MEFSSGIVGAEAPGHRGTGRVAKENLAVCDVAYRGNIGAVGFPLEAGSGSAPLNSLSAILSQPTCSGVW